MRVSGRVAVGVAVAGMGVGIGEGVRAGCVPRGPVTIVGVAVRTGVMGAAECIQAVRLRIRIPGIQRRIGFLLSGDMTRRGSS